MKTLYTFNNSCKVFALAILSFLLLLTGTQYANAQATKIFTIPGKNILVSYNELAAGQAGVVTFTLTNKAGHVITNGLLFRLELPAQQGLKYDLQSLKLGTGLSLDVPVALPIMRLIVDKNLENNSTLSFTCQMVR